MSGRRAHSPSLSLWLMILPLMIPAAVNAEVKSCPKVAAIKAIFDGKITYVKSTSISLGDKITVQIETVQIQEGEQKSCDLGPSSSQQATWLPGISNENALMLVPFLNGRPLPDISPEAIDPQEHTVTFHLVRTDNKENKEVWSDLLSRPGLSPRVVSFSVGLEKAAQIDSDVKTLNIVIFEKHRLFLAFALFLILLYIFFRLARWSTLLRDPGTTTDEPPRFKDLFWPPLGRPQTTISLGPYSLARTQMAFWFFLVIVSFVLIWMVIGDTDTITEGVLVLIGISAGTAVGATAIDSSKRPTTPAPQPGTPSDGWFTDILSDDTGISFHRFQIFVWTIVLGLVFVKAVFISLTMPDFSTNLLSLMGISSGTYLGLKPFERQAPEAPPETTTAGGKQGTQDTQETQETQETKEDEKGQEETTQ